MDATQNPIKLARGVWESSAPPPSDLNSIVKILRVDVLRFDSVNVEDWIYKIDNFFLYTGWL